jgi:hypothetical protein
VATHQQSAPLGRRRSGTINPAARTERARVAHLSEFFEPPPSEGLPRQQRPPSSGPPDGTLPGVVAIEPLLARSETAAIYVAHLGAYPTGFVFELKAISVTAEHETGLDVFGRHWPSAGEKRDEIPPELLRIGVQFADERKATNITGHHQPPAGPVMWPLGGGGGGGSFHQAYWVWPLPPAGPLAFVCEWPAAGIPLTRHEIDAQVILDAADSSAREFASLGQTRVKDGIAWRVGSERDIQWIRDGTAVGRQITAAIPPVFADYATLLHADAPGPRDVRQERQQDLALVELLRRHTPRARWWLGYLDTGASDIVFWDVPKVMLYTGWRYVLIEAGPEQAATWRPAPGGQNNWKSTELPDLIFPEDHAWLVSTLWDDDWSCIGGSEALIADLLEDRVLGPQVCRVSLSEDATPPGHTAQ